MRKYLGLSKQFKALVYVYLLTCILNRFARCPRPPSERKKLRLINHHHFINKQQNRVLLYSVS